MTKIGLVPAVRDFQRRGAAVDLVAQGRHHIGSQYRIVHADRHECRPTPFIGPPFARSTPFGDTGRVGICHDEFGEPPHPCLVAGIGKWRSIQVRGKSLV